MRTLRKCDIESMEKELQVLENPEKVLGGAKGDFDDPYTEEEMEAMLASGTWTYGFVSGCDGTFYTSASTDVSGSSGSSGGSGGSGGGGLPSSVTVGSSPFPSVEGSSSSSSNSNGQHYNDVGDYAAAFANTNYGWSAFFQAMGNYVPGLATAVITSNLQIYEAKVASQRLSVISLINNTSLDGGAGFNISVGFDYYHMTPVTIVRNNAGTVLYTVY
ncbi:hypothetical protein FACS1894160_3180 [Bacteroidia bacterium]|nr:hypothetical protein FACS1894123_05370 [Bacteroidia bacterium]GHV08607.1 hypothetical protein FACS1894160_3180 [Bacteroidia bacterium]